MKANFEIEGVKPMIFHKFNIEALTEVRKPKEGSSGNNPNEWKASFFQNDDVIYIPGAYLFACLKNGAVNTKAGRGTIQKTWISAVTIEDEVIYLDRKLFKGWQDAEIKDVPTDPNNPVFVDIRMVSNPNTKGKNVRYRLAVSKGWKLKFTLDVDESLISKSQVEKVVQDTGKLQGLCDGRTLGYGRFQVISSNFEKK
jgi:hypothetical protein